MRRKITFKNNNCHTCEILKDTCDYITLTNVLLVSSFRDYYEPKFIVNFARPITRYLLSFCFLIRIKCWLRLIVVPSKNNIFLIRLKTLKTMGIKMRAIIISIAIFGLFCVAVKGAPYKQNVNADNDVYQIGVGIADATGPSAQVNMVSPSTLNLV